MNDLKKVLANSINPQIYKIILSKPRSKSADIKKIVISQINEAYHLEKFTATQVFNENLGSGQLSEFLAQALEDDFLQYNGWDDQFEYIIQISKKGKPAMTRKAVSQAPARVGKAMPARYHTARKGAAISGQCSA